MERTLYVHGTYINFLRDVYDFPSAADEEMEGRVSANGIKVSMRASPKAKVILPNTDPQPPTSSKAATVALLSCVLMNMF